MRLTAREMILFMITLAIGLFGGTALLARPRLDEWKAVRRDQAELRAEIVQDRRLLDAREEWNGQFEELRGFLPQFPADKKMDIHWLSVMDDMAARSGVRITKRQVGEEQRMGDVFELPIEVRDWEGSLEALVGFLFELQSQGAMLDIRHLVMKPNEKKVLRGRFVLYCAYTRERQPRTGE